MMLKHSGIPVSNLPLSVREMTRGGFMLNMVTELFRNGSGRYERLIT